MARGYRKADTNPIDPYKAQPLPLGRPVAVYYRQSSEGQIGNISTTLQTVDMVDHLIKQGWQREQVIMIDMDGGISGTRKIKERPGMSYLYDLIEESAIGLVASQDVDRFFRDMAQIETNIFIDACRRNNVQVLTPTFVYDFAHPTQGRYHMQMFRDQAQRAADFLEFHIKGRLHKSRSFLSKQGQWMGHTVALGYMVDIRRALPDGTANPHFRKYTPFPPYADILLAYFQLFKQFNGNLRATFHHIERHGPFLPEFDETPPPSGFIFPTNLEKRSSLTGKLMLSQFGFRNVFRNAIYIGCWAVNRVIVDYHNHEPIIPLDLFMFAFNRLSPVNLEGEPNPHYAPQRPWVRHDKRERQRPPPTYSGAVFSSDTPDGSLWRMGTHWQIKWQGYTYAVTDKDRIKSVWRVSASAVDEQIDQLVLDRLRLTTIDEATWQQAIATTHNKSHIDIRRVQNAIRTTENAQYGIVESLKAVHHPELIQRLEADFIANQQTLDQLKHELQRLKASRTERQSLLDARPVLETIIQRWSDIPAEQRRDLFDAFAHHAEVERVDRYKRRLIIHWRDQSQSCSEFQPQKKYFPWTPEDVEKLGQMVEAQADQIELLAAFPGATWRAIRDYYGYHFGWGVWRKHYRGQVSYGPMTRWQDTAEYKVLPPNTQLTMSASRSYPCCSLLRAVRFFVHRPCADF